MFYVYMHRNLINGKIYIGQTNNPKKSWGSNGARYKPRPNEESRFWKAIQKYGWKNFEHIILGEYETREETNEAEIEFIKQYNSTNPDIGYNISSGGDRHDWYDNYTDEQKKAYQEKRREISYRLWQDEEYVAKQRKGMAEVMQTQEYKDKMREIMNERYKNEEYSKWHKQQCRKKNGQPIRCIETGEVYGSYVEAAEVLGLTSTSCFLKYFSGKNKVVKGKHWEKISVEEYEQIINCLNQ